MSKKVKVIVGVSIAVVVIAAIIAIVSIAGRNAGKTDNPDVPTITEEAEGTQTESETTSKASTVDEEDIKENLEIEAKSTSYEFPEDDLEE